MHLTPATGLLTVNSASTEPREPSATREESLMRSTSSGGTIVATEEKGGQSFLIALCVSVSE